MANISEENGRLLKSVDNDGEKFFGNTALASQKNRCDNVEMSTGFCLSLHASNNNNNSAFEAKAANIDGSKPMESREITSTATKISIANTSENPVKSSNSGECPSCGSVNMSSPERTAASHEAAGGRGSRLPDLVGSLCGVTRCCCCSASGQPQTVNIVGFSDSVEDKGGGLTAETVATDTTTTAAAGIGNVLSVELPERVTIEGRQAVTPVAHLEANATSALTASLDVEGAASLTPPHLSLPLNQNYSNRTSVNNSTENLSYSSDNYYPDDLILLDDDDDDDDVGGPVDDGDVEEISLNSDDCVYAYRGDGSDFDIVIDALGGSQGGSCGGVGGAGCGGGGVIGSGGAASHLIDDETDFLEMDFDPDPLSEVEGTVAEKLLPSHADAFLLQRDSCHLSGGRRSATNAVTNFGACRGPRQLFSSPTDDDLPPPRALQTQSLMSKNFARNNLHLDQIRGDGSDGGNDDEVVAPEDEAVHSLVAGGSFGSTPVALVATAKETQSLLPTREEGQPELKSSPSKVTGAKPKRLSSNFSAAASVSSKTSSKSRNSLRSSLSTKVITSVSFDERCISCSGFQSSAAAADSNNDDGASGSDDPSSCLDCLEKEFLASTIGTKATESGDCLKCRRHANRPSGVYAFPERRPHPPVLQMRCRSGSPTYFGDVVSEDFIFAAEMASDLLGVQSMRNSWQSERSGTRNRLQVVTNTEENAKDKIEDDMGVGGGIGIGGDARLEDDDDDEDDINEYQINALNVDASHIIKWHNYNVIVVDNENEMATAALAANQRLSLCDNFNSIQRIVTLSTVYCSETKLVQALDELEVSYNTEILEYYFKLNDATGGRPFRNLKYFLLHASKRNCNHPKLKSLIELVTGQRVHVQFEEDSQPIKTPLVPVRVADILRQWKINKNLDCLQQMDGRFVRANVLGKIANIVRQSLQTQQQQQRATPTTQRPLPEYITIPQYYPSGYLIITKPY